MKVRVIMPVGPGHGGTSWNATASVVQAWHNYKGPFTNMKICWCLDLKGRCGRSATRNRGLDKNPADWHFLLDADDTMMLHAFEMVDLKAAATFGAVCLDGKVSKENRWPLSREDLFTYGALGALNMGCFVRGDLGLRFDETLDVGEDFDYYCRLPNFTKLREPLCSVGYSKQSAGGPRSSQGCDWVTACNKILERYR